MAECPCSNISIMQLFHELKQKFPAVPDRVVSECIRQNGHNKEACEEELSRENQTYSSPSGRLCKMTAESSCERCRPDTLPLEDNVWDFNRHLIGRQSLDSMRCMRGGARRVFKRLSDEYLENSRHTQREHNEDSLQRFPRSLFPTYDDDLCAENFQMEQQNFENRTERLNNRAQYRETSVSASDEKLQFESEQSCHCERTRVSVVSYGRRTPHSAPVTPSNYRPPPFPPLTVDVTAQRHCTALNIDPSPHYTTPSEPHRPFTSVNLTLRLPSSDPQPPIDISSGGGGLTYSSCSYDPKQGYQSKLQISIGPGGSGTAMAARTKPPRPPPPTTLKAAISMPDVATTSSLLLEPETQNLEPATKARLSEQLERKARLETELAKEKEKLRVMQQEKEAMQQDLDARLRAPLKTSQVQRLLQDIRSLQAECSRMTSEVDLSLDNTTVPLGETNEEFYKNIYTGPLLTQQIQRHRRPAPPRPPPPPPPHEMRLGRGYATHHEEPNWTCHVCTFRNHPLLDKCEQCEMPRIVPGSYTATTPCKYLTKA
uniref:RanBP2-type domain-containing protein n=3 Tax=Clastoptera arizonana TaxID=38151 RepID=A0A1B6CJY8_9HEMI